MLEKTAPRQSTICEKIQSSMSYNQCLAIFFPLGEKKKKKKGEGKKKEGGGRWGKKNGSIQSRAARRDWAMPFSPPCHPHGCRTIHHCPERKRKKRGKGENTTAWAHRGMAKNYHGIQHGFGRVPSSFNRIIFHPKVRKGRKKKGEKGERWGEEIKASVISPSSGQPSSNQPL